MKNGLPANCCTSRSRAASLVATCWRRATCSTSFAASVASSCSRRNDVEQLEVALCIMRGFEDLAAQTRKHKRKTATCEDSQYFRSQHYCAVQILSELRAVEHHEGAATSGGNSLRRAETEAHECFVVVAEAQAVVRFDELFDPFEIGRRRELEQFLQASVARWKRPARCGGKRCIAGRRC